MVAMLASVKPLPDRDWIGPGDSLAVAPTSTDGQGNTRVHEQVLEFVQMHNNVITSLVKDIHRQAGLQQHSQSAYHHSLVALRLITALFYFLYSGPLCQHGEAESPRPLQGEVHRLNPLVLHIFTLYSAPEKSKILLEVRC